MRKYGLVAAFALILLGIWMAMRPDSDVTKNEPPPTVPVVEQPVALPASPVAPDQPTRPVAPRQPAQQTISLDKPAGAEVHVQQANPEDISYNAKQPPERQVLPNVTITKDRALSIKLSAEQDRSVDIRHGSDGKDYQVQWKQKF